MPGAFGSLIFGLQMRHLEFQDTAYGTHLKQ